jgi:hypothetical protein
MLGSGIVALLDSLIPASGAMSEDRVYSPRISNCGPNFTRFLMLKDCQT